MSRIISGAAGGTPLVSVPGSLTRPTTDRVKEALFSRLDAFEVIAGARVLDLYAGSGSLGVESASRGALSVDLVEFDAKASAVCQRNADLVNTVARRKVVSVHRSKVESFLDRTADGVLLGPGVPRPALPAGRAGAGRRAGQAAAAPGERRRRRGGTLGPDPRARHGPRAWNGSRRRSTARPGCGSPSRRRSAGVRWKTGRAASGAEDDGGPDSGHAQRGAWTYSVMPGPGEDWACPPGQPRPGGEIGMP